MAPPSERSDIADEFPACPLPERETERLEALRAYGVLDSPPEDRFDWITQLSCQLFGVPIALISLVDHDRQWFLSRSGLEACQTDRRVAFCAHSICQEGVLVVEDARQDPRFCDNPLVSGPPGIRFYAGAPLRTAEGHALGTLCLIDTHPRRFTVTETKLLLHLAAMVMEQLEAYRCRQEELPEQQRQAEAWRRCGRREFERARRFSRPLALLCLGMDPLAPGGSDPADASGSVMERLLEELRDQDQIAATSHDRVDVLLLEVDPTDLERVAERLRVLAEGVLAHPGGLPRVWGGVACLDAHDRSFEDLTRRARLLERLAQASGRATIRSLGDREGEASREEERILLEELAALMLQPMTPGQAPGSGPEAGAGAKPVLRQEFFALGQDEWERARRFHRPLSVLLFDLDHLALVNERWGRTSGDAVLQTVVGIIRDQLRHQDQLGRLGSDSFGVLMLETPVQGAAAMAERIRERVAAHAFTGAELATFVTLSGGSASLLPSDQSFQTLFDRAEHSLQLAKATGRNRVRLDGRASSHVAR
ncbi:MAG: diguanylate cyclase [Synechococcus sp.]